MANVRTYKVDGISIKLPSNIVNDYTIKEKVFAVSRPETGTEGEELERGYQATQLIDFVLGKEKGRILKEMRQKNDGHCEFEDVLSWVMKLINKISDQNAALKK